MRAILQLSRRRVRRGSHLHGIRYEALRRAERDRLLRGARRLALRLSESFATADDSGPRLHSSGSVLGVPPRVFG